MTGSFCDKRNIELMVDSCKKCPVTRDERKGKLQPGYLLRKADRRLKAVQSVVEKHREGVEQPYLIAGGAKEVLRLLFDDLQRVLAD